MPDTPVRAERPTLFFLHALGLSRDEFAEVERTLASDFNVVALDLPGFGDLTTAEGTTVEDMVASVTRRIRASRATHWALVGHSMGGKIASIVAARTMSGRSGLFGLAGVVLLAASPPSPEPMSEDRRSEMLSWAQNGPLSADKARDFVDANVGSALDPDSDALALADLGRASPEAWTAWLARGSREDWSGEVGTLDIPALIVAGGADGDLGAGAQRRLNGVVYPRATFLTLEGAGHLLPLERPAEVSAAISTLWRDRAGTGPVVPADVAHTIASTRTSSRTRGILAGRALADDPRYEPAVLTPGNLATLRTLADRVVPQDGAAIDLAARVDTQLAAGEGDGWRNAALPADPAAYRLCLDALADLAELSEPEQDERLGRIAEGEFSPGGDGGATAEQLTAWFEDARVDLVRQWLAHPATMSRIGFDGFANGGDGLRIQGFQLLAAGTREGWEPSMEGTR